MATLNKDYIDISINGDSRTGDFIRNNIALDNAFRIWLLSEKNERLRTQSGNWLLKHLGKQMTDERAREIKSSIQTGIERDFNPSINIRTLEVIADYKNKKWVIVLVAYAPALNVGISNRYYVTNNI